MECLTLNTRKQGPSRRYQKARGLNVAPRPKRATAIPHSVRRSMEYILERYEPELNCGCWLWLGSTDRDGYGTQWVAGRIIYAHRLSYEHHVGPIPDGLFVRHKCDTPACINPRHLLVGNQFDNMRDAVERGRTRWARAARGLA